MSTGTLQANATCLAQAENKWAGLAIQASSQGDSCDDAVVMITIRDKSGKPIWARAHIASQLLNFTDAPIADSKSMEKKLNSWISGAGFMHSVEKLNVKAEFPFMVSADIDAKTFAAYRKQKRPIFCYVQGMESGNCLMIDKDGAVVEIGVQSFPG